MSRSTQNRQRRRGGLGSTPRPPADLSGDLSAGRSAPQLYDQAAPDVPETPAPPVPETVPDPVPAVPETVPADDPVTAELRLAELRALLADVEGEAALKARKRELALAALEQKADLATTQRVRDAELATAHTDVEVAEIRAMAAARRWKARGKRWRKRLVTSVLRARRTAVNLGITGAAVYGQWQYLTTATNLGSPGALAVSVLVELLAVSVLDYAHRRRKAGRASWHLYGTAAVMAAAVGAMNFGHWSTSDLPLVGALFFLFSLAGPLLWSLSALEAEAELDDAPAEPAAPRAAGFPLAQWALFPAETFAAKRLAVRHAIPDPGAALDLLTEQRATRRAERAERKKIRGKRAVPPVEAPATPPADPPVEAPVDDAVPPLDPPLDQTVPPVDQSVPEPPPSLGYELEGVPAADALAAMTPREKQAAARATARKAIAAGHRPTGDVLGAAYGLSGRWGRARLDEVDNITSAA